MRWCVDKRVVIGLGAVVLVGLAVRPGWLVVALPLLVALVCPLSMLLMMRGRTTSCGAGSAARAAEITRLRQEIHELKNRDSGGAEERRPAL